MTASAHDYPLLIKHLLHTPLANASRQEIVYRDLRRHDYRTLRDRIGRLADGLASLGIRRGDVVAVMDWDSHRYLECFFAVPMMGAVLQTVNVRLWPEQILYTLNHTGARVLLVHADFLPMLAPLAERLESIEQFIVLTDDGVPPGSSIRCVGEYEALLDAASPDFEFEDFDEHTRATVFYTTGTTGLPKGVHFSHRQLVLHTLALSTALGTSNRQGRFHREDVYMPITPMFHVHAWGMPYVATLAGAKQVYPGRYSPDRLLQMRSTEAVTFSHGVPTVLDMLLRAPEAQHVDLTGWKFLIGGARLPKTLAQAAVERGMDVFMGYGMSETCPVLTLSQLESGLLESETTAQLDRRTKAGRAIPLVQLRTVDTAMQDVEGGEIVVRAPWAATGYLSDASASTQLWRHGYLHTGDTGRIDSDGVLQITDRMKDLIKSGGEWISTQQLEDMIAEHAGVSEVAVIGVPDERWGERPLAIVVRSASRAAEVCAADIIEHIKQQVELGLLPKFGIPDRVEFVPALDKTSVGKLDKKRLREKYAQ